MVICRAIHALKVFIDLFCVHYRSDSSLTPSPGTPSYNIVEPHIQTVVDLIVGCAGDPNAQWAYFQEQKQVHVNLRLRLSAGNMTEWNEPGTFDGTIVEAKWPKLGPSKIVKNTRIGEASDFWNRYEQDIQLAKDLGATKSPCTSLSLQSCTWS